MSETRATTDLPNGAPTDRPSDASARPTTLLRGRVVLPEAVLPDGLVVVTGDRLAWVGPVDEAPDDLGPLPSPGPWTLLPGLVDLHCHGGGGAGFPDAVDAGAARRAVDEHLRHGTTTLVASLVTADPATLLERTATLAGLADAGEIAGVHLEGPFLSTVRCGAQVPERMRDGDPDLVRDVAAAARGHLVTMTVAPEVPGVRGPGGVLDTLAEVGAVPSIGHTDASATVTREALAEARAALTDGRSPRPTVTHLFNGMRPLHHRDPGPVAACLAAAARGEAVVELVADGVHLDPETVRSVLALAPHHTVLVTDAMAAAGMADGSYVLGGAAVRVEDGVARLVDGGALAGGTSRLIDQVRHAVGAGVPLVDAVRAASLTPAGVLGRTDVGALEAGRRADLVVVDADLRPVRVLRSGRWVAGRDLGLVPRPAQVHAAPGTPWRVPEDVVVVADGSAAPAQARAVERLIAALARPVTGADDSETGAAAGTDAGPGRTVCLQLADLDVDVEDPDRRRAAYRLEVTSDGAVVTAEHVTGLRHGVTCLAQLLEAAHRPDGSVVVEPVTVVDVPRFAWRGLSLDVARHPLPLPDLLRVLDVLADLRLDVLHLHLTDDQGWRLEVPSRPALTERSGATAVDGDPGGFLTVDDWTDLLAAAQERGITVVPEVDVPGHVNAALHAYGELTPDGVAPEPYTGIEVGFSRLHADLPTTTPFLQDVLGDVARMIPGPYVHVGGDEVLTMETEEYVRLVRTAADVVEGAGRTVVGWQEVAKAPLTPGTVVQVWDRREDLGPVVAAAEAGARVLLSPGDRVYLDMKYDASTELGLEWAGHISLPHAYAWDPDEAVPGLDARHVVGVEAAIFSETTRSLADVTSLLLPRLAAVAEVAWTPQEQRDPADFLVRVAGLARRWDAADLRWTAVPEVAWDHDGS